MKRYLEKQKDVGVEFESIFELGTESNKIADWSLYLFVLKTEIKPKGILNIKSALRGICSQDESLNMDELNE